MSRALLSRKWTPDALKLDLAQLRDDEPDAFVYCPGDGEIAYPPVNIWLAAWAVDLAEYLHTRHGWRVRLVVGNMEFPHRRLQGRQSLLTGWHFDEGTTPMEPGEMIVNAEEPLVVQTGHVLRSHLIVRNLTREALQLSFDGPPAFTGIVIDPISGTHVNGSFRAFESRQSFVDVAPEGEARIALVVDTASSDPGLGYAVPPGRWGMQVVALANARRLLAPSLPLTVESGQAR
jgi:hypothetical protein